MSSFPIASRYNNSSPFDPLFSAYSESGQNLSRNIEKVINVFAENSTPKQVALADRSRSDRMQRNFRDPETQFRDLAGELGYVVKIGAPEFIHTALSYFTYEMFSGIPLHLNEPDSDESERVIQFYKSKGVDACQPMKGMLAPAVTTEAVTYQSGVSELTISMWVTDEKLGMPGTTGGRSSQAKSLGADFIMADLGELQRSLVSGISKLFLVSILKAASVNDWVSVAKPPNTASLDGESKKIMKTQFQLIWGLMNAGLKSPHQLLEMNANYEHVLVGGSFIDSNSSALYIGPQSDFIRMGISTAIQTSDPISKLSKFFLSNSTINQMIETNLMPGYSIRGINTAPVNAGGNVTYRHREKGPVYTRRHQIPLFYDFSSNGEKFLYNTEVGEFDYIPNDDLISAAIELIKATGDVNPFNDGNLFTDEWKNDAVEKVIARLTSGVEANKRFMAALRLTWPVDVSNDTKKAKLQTEIVDAIDGIPKGNFEGFYPLIFLGLVPFDICGLRIWQGEISDHVSLRTPSNNLVGSAHPISFETTLPHITTTTDSVERKSNIAFTSEVRSLINPEACRGFSAIKPGIIQRSTSFDGLGTKFYQINDRMGHNVTRDRVSGLVELRGDEETSQLGALYCFLVPKTRHLPNSFLFDTTTHACDLNKEMAGHLVDVVTAYGLSESLSKWSYWVKGNVALKDEFGGFRFIKNQANIVEWKVTEGSNPFTSEILLPDGYTSSPIQIPKKSKF